MNYTVDDETSDVIKYIEKYKMVNRISFNLIKTPGSPPKI